MKKNKAKNGKSSSKEIPAYPARGFPNTWLQEVFSHVDDRSKAILCAAFLEDSLGRILRAFFVHPDEKKESQIIDDILNPVRPGPLGGFMARVRAAFCLGLLSWDEFESLKVIAKIRNKFAHGTVSISFGNEEIVEQTDKFKRYKKRPHPEKICEFTSEDAWVRFHSEAATIAFNLERRINLIRHRAKYNGRLDEWPGRPEEPEGPKENEEET